jgi:hypothetical protein
MVLKLMVGCQRVFCISRCLNAHIPLESSPDVSSGSRFVGITETQTWGILGRGPHLPKGLVDLTLPQFSLPASLGHEINRLPGLTRLDCLLSGFFPSKELVGLKVQYPVYHICCEAIYGDVVDDFLP